MATEAAIFAYLIFSYFYLGSQADGDWPPMGLPSLRLAAPNTAVLLLSSLALFWAERSGARRNLRGRLLLGLGVAFLLGAGFVLVQLVEWRDKPFTLHSDLYGSIYFTMTGFHLVHVVVGLGILMALFLWALLGHFNHQRHAALTIGAIYWHFVDAVWVLLFAVLYIVPRLR
ncbi:MAG: cytochrome c oxidase subunit 3 [Pseudomonadota bacterium]